MLTPDEWSAVSLSLQVAAGSAAICCGPAVFFGWLLARKRFVGKSLLDALLHLPLVLPPVAVGLILLWLLGQQGGLGAWLYRSLGVRLAFTQAGAILAAAVMGFPLMVRAVRLAVELVDVRLEQAAAAHGASPWRVLWTVTLPLARPGIVTGLILAFARSLGEFGATITFAGNFPGVTQTMPLLVYEALNTDPEAARVLSLVMLGVSVGVLALLRERWFGQVLP
jgi:molybdate transport system permease protein